MGLIAIFLDVATSTSFINFGAFTAFTLVNVAVVFHYVRQRRAGQNGTAQCCTEGALLWVGGGKGALVRSGMFCLS